MTQLGTPSPPATRSANNLAVLVQSFAAWLDRRRLGLCCGALLALEAVIFLFLVAGYRMFASVSVSRGDHEEHPERALSHRPWPPDGVGPPTVT